MFKGQVKNTDGAIFFPLFFPLVGHLPHQLNSKKSLASSCEVIITNSSNWLASIVLTRGQKCSPQRGGDINCLLIMSLIASTAKTRPLRFCKSRQPLSQPPLNNSRERVLGARRCLHRVVLVSSSKHIANLNNVVVNIRANHPSLHSKRQHGHLYQNPDPADRQCPYYSVLGKLTDRT